MHNSSKTQATGLSDSEIKTTIRDFLQQNFMVADGFDDTDSFLRTGIIDSLGVLELMEFIECTYGFKPDTKDIIPDNFDSVDRLVGFVSRNLAATSDR